jgi:hypothetical protein
MTRQHASLLATGIGCVPPTSASRIARSPWPQVDHVHDTLLRARDRGVDCSFGEGVRADSSKVRTGDRASSKE